MDALKFAFEILIVGALALPWAAILIRMFTPVPASAEPGEQTDSLQFFLTVLPEHTRDAVAAVLILAIGYLLGSTVSRISRNFFDDELLRGVPSEAQIRDSVYWDEYCAGKLLGDLQLPHAAPDPVLSIAEGLCTPQTLQNTGASTLSPPLPNPPSPRLQLFRLYAFRGRTPKAEIPIAKPPNFEQNVQELFLLQESELLLNGQDKVERLKEYYDQITVLRGAAFNGIILLAVCLFGVCGNLWVRWSQRPWLKLLTLVPAGVVAVYGFFSLLNHWSGAKSMSGYRDPPLAELVFLLLGAVGLTIIPKLRPATYYLPACAVAAVLTVISFGGWWWTEVMYDLHVIHSVPDLPPIHRDAGAQTSGETQ